jgi:hypothetical protein
MTIANELFVGVAVGPVPLALAAICAIAQLRLLLATQKNAGISILSIFGISPFIVAFGVYYHGFQRSDLSAFFIASACVAATALNLLVMHFSLRLKKIDVQIKNIPSEVLRNMFLSSFAVTGAFLGFFVIFPQALTNPLPCQRQICYFIEVLVGSRSYIFVDLWLIVFVLGLMTTALAFSIYSYFVRKCVALR